MLLESSCCYNLKRSLKSIGMGVIDSLVTERGSYDDSNRPSVVNFRFSIQKCDSSSVSRN